MENFLEWLKEECLPGVWSKGVQLSRNSKSMERLSSGTESSELKFKLQTTERMLAFQVTLWPKDQDAHCNCGSKVEPCHHIVAVALALENGILDLATSSDVPSKPLNSIQYTWVKQGTDLMLNRALILDGKEVEFPSSLTSFIGGIHSGRIKSPLPSVSPLDLKLDEMFIRERIVLSISNAASVLSILADLPAIRAEGIEGVEQLTVSSSRTNAAIEIVDEGDSAIRVKGGGSPKGYVIEGNVLKLSPPLTSDRVLQAHEFAHFVRVELPKLRELAAVEVQTTRLPKLVEHEPKLTLHFEETKDGSYLTARMEYPKLFSDEVFVKDLKKEGVLVKQAREKYGLAMDQPLKLDGKQALELREKIDDPALRARIDSALPGILNLKGKATLDQILSQRDTLMKLLAMKEKREPAIAKNFDAMITSLLSESASDQLGKKPKFGFLQKTAASLLRDYQKDGVKFLQTAAETLGGAILADDMGLGKTLQTLAILQKPSLVIAPTSLLSNWKSEALKFRPDLKICVYHGQSRRWDEAADVVISSYSLLRQEPERFLNVQWDAVVLDEAHVIRNPDTQASIASSYLKSNARIALTGTPIQNHPRDLFSLFRFIAPGVFEDEMDLDPKFIAPYLLRRTKVQVLPSLPPKTYLEHWVELSSEERSTYEAVLAAGKTEIAKRLGDDGTLTPLTFFELLLRAREACDHVGLVDSTKWNAPSSKLTRIRELVEELHEEGHSVLIFSQWTRFLDRLEQEFKGTPLLRLDGSTENRGEVVAQFQESATPAVFLLSLHAGGVGLNLTRATHVIFCDPWWNPFVELQAEDRAYRIGQEKPVTIHRILAQDTIETQIQELKATKFAMNDAVLKASDLKDL